MMRMMIEESSLDKNHEEFQTKEELFVVQLTEKENEYATLETFYHVVFSYRQIHLLSFSFLVSKLFVYGV
jgi:hypothetical protein